MVCSCTHHFEPSLETFHDAQIIPNIQYTLLYTCPVCLSSRSLLMWESYDLAIHFGEADDDNKYEELLAAE